MQSALGPWIDRPLRAVDPDVAPFWEGLKQHEFLLCRCRRCGSWWFPFTVCNLHDDLLDYAEMEWVASSGRGTIYAMLVVHQVVDEAFVDEVPYVLAMVELEEGPHFPARLIGSPESFRIGGRVEVIYVDSDQAGHTLPLFGAVS